MDEILTYTLTGLSFLVLFLVVLLFAKIINDFLTPYSIDEHVIENKNFALALSLSGYFAGTLIIFVASMLGPSKSLMNDLLTVGGYSLLGIILLNVARVINDKVILYQFSNVKEIIEDKNAGTGAVQFGSYIASSFVIAGAIHGEGGGPLTALAFFAFGQISLIIFTWLYNLITPYNIHHEIENDCIAAGVALGGTLIAVGIILMKGTAGDFIGWTESLIRFAENSLIAFLLLPVVRWIVDKLIIPKANLNDEIKERHNTGAGILEMTVAISFATVLFFVV